MVKSIIDSLTDIAIKNARAENIKSIGLSGGVSYNLAINDMVYEKLKDTEFDLVVHNSVCNGDGAISIGQNAIIGHKLKT